MTQRMEGYLPASISDLPNGCMTGTGDADPVVAMVHFEGLLVRKDGWLMVMEYQKSSATFEEWEAAK